MKCQSIFSSKKGDNLRKISTLWKIDKKTPKKPTYVGSDVQCDNWNRIHFQGR